LRARSPVREEYQQIRGAHVFIIVEIGRVIRSDRLIGRLILGDRSWRRAVCVLAPVEVR